MAGDEFAIVPFTIPTGVIVGSTFDVTSGDITDFKHAILFVFGTPNVGTQSDHARRSIGFCDDLGNGSCASPVATDNVTSGAGVCTTRVAENNGGPALCVIIGTPNTTASGSQVCAYSPVDRVTSGLANGIQLSCVIASDAAYRGVAILFGGSANRTITRFEDAGVVLGYPADLAVNLCTNTTLGTQTGLASVDYQPNFGGATRLPTLRQAAISGEWDRSSPTDCDVIVQSTRFGAEVNADAVTSDHQVTAIDADSIDCDTPIGSGLGSFGIAMQFTDASRPAGIVVESLTGATGQVSFSQLGFKPRLVFGVATLVNATGTLTDGPTAAVEGIFCFNLAGTQHAASMRFEEGLTLVGGGSPVASQASTLYDTKALLLLDHQGNIVCSADWVSMDELGFTLNFGVGSTGRMVLVGIGSPLQTSETIEIQDAFLVPYIAALFGETVEVSEGLQAITWLVTGETVEILDGSELDVASVLPPTQADQLGRTTEWGAVRGRTVEGGAELGSTTS